MGNRVLVPDFRTTDYNGLSLRLSRADWSDLDGGRGGG